MRFISYHKIEQGLICDRVGAVVVGEFCVRDLISPGTRVASTEDLKVYFNLLVDMFSPTVILEVISSTEEEVIVEELSKFLGEGRGELSTTIRDDFVIKSKAEVDFVEKKSHEPLGGDSFLDGAENYLCCKTMVNHNQ